MLQDIYIFQERRDCHSCLLEKNELDEGTIRRVETKLGSGWGRGMSCTPVGTGGEALRDSIITSCSFLKEFQRMIGSDKQGHMVFQILEVLKTSRLPLPQGCPREVRGRREEGMSTPLSLGSDEH